MSVALWVGWIVPTYQLSTRFRPVNESERIVVRTCRRFSTSRKEKNDGLSLPMVTFVPIEELSDASVRLYGGAPPAIVSPQGWQVVRTSDTLATTVNAGAVDGGGMHAVVCPAVLPLSGYLNNLRALRMDFYQSR
jgi:hypothetical protein